MLYKYIQYNTFIYKYKYLYIILVIDGIIIVPRRN